jgi:TetR/AcrR family transcriptional regulator
MAATTKKKIQTKKPTAKSGKKTEGATEKKQTKGFYTGTFANISPEKRNRIIKAASAEFAKNGYNGASINVIAEKADISIGSMYSYFDSKDSLYLTVLDSGYSVIAAVFESVDAEGTDIYTAVERILQEAKANAKKHKELIQMYLELATEGLSGLSAKLPAKIESLSSGLYGKLIAKGKKQGIVDQSVNEEMAAFCIDNLILMYQFSFCSEHYRERMKTFLGKKGKDGDEAVTGIVSFIRAALSPKKKA